MEITKRDIEETRFVGELINKVNNIDITEASNVSERIVKNQPFIMSLLIGYKLDVEGEELDDIMRMLFMIYLFFEKYTDIKKKQITSKDFEKREKTNLHFLKYFEGEENKQAQLELNKAYFSNLRFKSLFTGILTMAKTQSSLSRMNPELKGIVILGMKTLIDCLESNLLGGNNPK